MFDSNHPTHSASLGCFDLFIQKKDSDQVEVEPGEDHVENTESVNQGENKDAEGDEEKVMSR